MATERQLQFRVGLLVLVSLGIGGWLVELQSAVAMARTSRRCFCSSFAAGEKTPKQRGTDEPLTRIEFAQTTPGEASS